MRREGRDEGEKEGRDAGGREREREKRGSGEEQGDSKQNDEKFTHENGEASKRRTMCELILGKELPTHSIT